VELGDQSGKLIVFRRLAASKLDVFLARRNCTSSRQPHTVSCNTPVTSFDDERQRSYRADEASRFDRWGRVSIALHPTAPDMSAKICAMLYASPDMRKFVNDYMKAVPKR